MVLISILFFCNSNEYSKNFPQGDEPNKIPRAINTTWNILRR
jgi:hypothetical protein